MPPSKLALATAFLLAIGAVAQPVAQPNADADAAAVVGSPEDVAAEATAAVAKRGNGNDCPEYVDGKCPDSCCVM